jgi:hypothetical protein
MSDTMLVKTGAVNGQVSRKIPIPIESFNYMMRMMETRHQHCLEFAKNRQFQTKVKITTDNLTLSVDKVKCTRWAVTARTVEGFEALREVIGRVGYGLKKRHPNLSAINSNDGRNRLTVQEHDLIHVVHLDEHEVLYNDNSMSELTHVNTPTRPPTNFIRLAYDSLNRQLSLTIRCYSTLVSLLSADARSYLRSSNIVTGNVFVLYNNRVWKVIRNNQRAGQTLLAEADNDNNTVWVETSVVDANEIR